MCLNTRSMAAAARAHPHSIIHTCNSSSTHSRLSRHCLRSLLLKGAEAAIRCQRLYSPPRLSRPLSAAAAAAASSASTRAAPPPSPPLPCRCDGCRLRSPGHTRPSVAASAPCEARLPCEPSATSEGGVLPARRQQAPRPPPPPPPPPVLPGPLPPPPRRRLHPTVTSVPCRRHCRRRHHHHYHHGRGREERVDI